METSEVSSRLSYHGQVVHLKRSHASHTKNKWIYSSSAKIIRDVETLNNKQSGYFKNSKHCFGRKMELISLV